MKKTKSKISAQYWDDIAENVQPSVSNVLWRKHADFLNSRLLERFLPSSGGFQYSLKTDLFDESIGAGLSHALSGISREVAGMDISLNTVRNALRNQDNLIGVSSDILAPPFREKSFDLILSNSTLDHFSSDNEIQEALKYLAELLKPGGHLIWTMDNPTNPIVGLRNFLSIRFGTMGTLVPYQMGKTWRLGKMTSTARELGLDVRDCARIMHCPRILVIQYLKYLKMIRKNSSGKISLKLLKSMEILESLPTRALSAHYNVVHAVRRS